MEKREYDRKQFISTLTKIGHGDLSAYISQGTLAAEAEPEFFAHFIAWNEIKGKVRDSKVAYPVIALRNVAKNDRDLAENAVAHLMKLSPRDLVRAYDFSKKLTNQGHPIKAGFRRMLEQGLRDYLQAREDHFRWWERTVLQHRDSMKRLYRMSHKRPSPRAQAILFDGEYPANSIFAKVAALRTMTPKEAAGVILTEKIPFEVAVGAVAKIKDPAIILALIEGMTGNQIVNNSKMLERLGVKKDPALNAAYQAALVRAKDDKKLNVLKTSRITNKTVDPSVTATMTWMEPQQLMRGGIAAASIDTDPIGADMQADLLQLQAHATKQLGGIEGDWLILGDMSGSMHQSIELAKKVASLITERVKGKVWLIFFANHPTAYDVSGKNYFQIQEMTRHLRAGGMTSIGCGLDYLLRKKESVDGIVIVSDGGDNTHPLFGATYKKYVEQIGHEPTVYWFDVPGDGDALTHQLPGVIEKFDMKHGQIDYYSLPNIITTLRTNKYSMVDEIMGVPLLKMADALRKEN